MIEGLFQPMHLLFLLGLALLFFGPSKLPELGKGLGSSIKNFRSALKEGLEEDSKPQPQPQPQQLAAVKPAADDQSTQA